MRPEDIALIFFGIVFIAYLVGNPFRRRQRRFSNKFKYNQNYSSRPNLANPEIAMQYVQANQYSVRPLMNKSVYPVFKITERFFKEMNLGHRVIPEICMGAVLQCANEEGFSSINSKRIDIGVIDWAGNLILAIEYNGSGHYQGNAMGRDAVKRMALNKAQIPLIEIIPDDTEVRIIEKIRMASGIRSQTRENNANS